METDMDTEHDQLALEEDHLATALSEFRAATEPEMPKMVKPRDGIVHLMYGLNTESGERSKVAEVRELTGEDEEVLSRLRNDHNYAVNLVDMIIRRATVRIGDVDVQADQSVLGELLTADRDLLFKEIVVETFGEDREFEEIECPNCQSKNDIRLTVDGILDINGLENDDPTFVVTLKDGTKLSMHYMLGKEQRRLFESDKPMTMAEYNTLAIAECLDEIDGERAVQKKKFAVRMGMQDRDTVLKALRKGPSVRFKEVEVPCPTCETKIPFAFGWADLLPL